LDYRKTNWSRNSFGLSLSYDIVKAHVGELLVETKEGDGLPVRQAGYQFIIQLPLI
jgi:signal transduction histidine kinase